MTVIPRAIPKAQKKMVATSNCRHLSSSLVQTTIKCKIPLDIDIKICYNVLVNKGKGRRNP